MYPNCFSTTTKIPQRQNNRYGVPPRNRNLAVSCRWSAYAATRRLTAENSKTLTEIGSRRNVQSTLGGATSHHSDGNVSCASPRISGDANSLSGMSLSNVMFMWRDLIRIGSSPATRRDNRSLAMLSTASVIIFGTVRDAYITSSTTAVVDTDYNVKHCKNMITLKPNNVATCNSQV